MTEIIADKLNMLSRYQSGEARPQSNYQADTPAAPSTTPSATNTPSATEEKNGADDLPF